MSYGGITWAGFGLRFLLAAVLVFASYNPSGWSFFHWTWGGLDEIGPLMILAGVVLLIGWTIYLRATLRSLGPFGLLLATAFFAALIWLVIDLGWLAADTTDMLIYLGELVLCAVLATGISWSHIRRRITGQADVDEVDE